ncbi:MAG: L-serine ammonia-lyase, iron-sulfur-dependent, subunit alpha [Synergistaceae bacterium]|nr:L-serine ammonia-lyase, iron-sulfur-dependent, subunit alpha [Synergistaceae bacterium]
MKITSVFNNVLGPVMRGPSSSHTAASFHIGRMALDILGSRPKRVVISFDEDGSYGRVYREQGSDRAFVSGLMDWDLLDEGFHDALDRTAREGCSVEFMIGRFPEANHPNWMRLDLDNGEGNKTSVIAASIGGGSVTVSGVDGFPTDIRGDSWTTLVETGGGETGNAAELLAPHGRLDRILSPARAKSTLLALQSADEPPATLFRRLAEIGVRPRLVRPIFFPIKGSPIWNSAGALEDYTDSGRVSIAEAALDYECALLGMTPQAAIDEMRRRYSIMKGACERGLSGELASPMQLLRPTAHKIFASGLTGGLRFFGPHSKAAARAMAVMHANSGMDVVCAAPTGGAAGALPGTVITLEEELGLSAHEVCMTLFAAGAIGVVLDTRATFAAEVAGCQVEIGAGGAMASAACVYAAGGTVRQALDAAAISFQNTMGSVCDPVQGTVEIPCHTRNASLAAAAFVNADIIMGGYENGIPLDETIDAVYETGKLLPPELRCTSLGGISLCPSAMAMKRMR